MAASANPWTIPLSFGAEQIVSRALHEQEAAGQGQLGLHHWLVALLEQQGAAAKAIIAELDPGTVAADLKKRVGEGDVGEPLTRETVIQQAAARAHDLDHPVIQTADLAAVLLEAGGDLLGKQVPKPVKGLDGAAEPKPRPKVRAYVPRATQPTPVLDEFGRDLTKEALEGTLPAIVGREQELGLIEEIICRRTKRNPALIGPAGTGKTAIVEGFAQRIVVGDVPEPLQGIRLIALQPSNLTAGAGIVGELEKRMKAVLAEASQDGIVLFIDELHTVVGSGGRLGVGDVGALLKPSLARGEISVIGATTDDEYRMFVESDKALERRFYPVPVQEMTVAETRVVMAAHRQKLETLRGVEVEDVVLDWLLDFADQYLRNRYFPDKGVDLLEQCVAHAVVAGESKVTLADARTVAERTVGMPIDLRVRLEHLEQELVEQGLLTVADADRLSDRIAITADGLDVRPQRPNAVVLLTGEAATIAESLAVTVAETLFGGAERVVEIDFGQFDTPEDLNTLVGPPPGYIGFGGRLPLHEVAQMPWCVLLCKNVDGCHPEVAQVLGQGLADGVVTERSGRRIYLSDAVVLLTASAGAAKHVTIGFPVPPAAADKAEPAPASDAAARKSAEKLLGADFVGQVDVVCTELPETAGVQREWAERSLLAELADRYRHRRLLLEWDEGFVDWILAERKQNPRRSDLLRIVEDTLGELLISRLPGADEGEAAARLTVSDGVPTAVASRRRKKRRRVQARREKEVTAGEGAGGSADRSS